MSSSLFNMMDLDRLQPERLPGCRLQRLEVYNWGTFTKTSGPSARAAATPCSPATSAPASQPSSTPSPHCSSPLTRFPTTGRPALTPASGT